MSSIMAQASNRMSQIRDIGRHFALGLIYITLFIFEKCYDDKSIKTSLNACSRQESYRSKMASKMVA